MTWLEGKVRGASLARVMLSVLVIAGAIGLLAYNQRYLRNYFTGAYTIPAAELAAAKAVEDLPRYWVTLKPDRVFDTGIDQITINKRRGVETGRSVTGHYYIGQIGDRFLMIRGHGEPDIKTATLTGGLVEPRQDVLDRVTSSPQTAPLKAKFLPMLLDTEDFRSNGHALLGIAGLVTLGALIFGLISMARVFRPRGHKALRALAASPEADITDVSRRIQADVEGRRAAKLKDGYQVTSSHLVRTSPFSFDLAPLSDLLWAYPVVIQKKMYGFIPTGKIHQVSLNFKDGTRTVKGREQQVQNAMAEIGRSAPWAMIGYSGDLEQAYKKQRQELTAFVEDRRQHVLQSWATMSPPAAQGPTGTV